jgi:hypothetical protein
MPRVVTVAGRARPGPPANPADRDATAPADRAAARGSAASCFLPSPVTAAGEVLIPVAAFGLNHAEAARDHVNVIIYDGGIVP